LKAEIGHSKWPYSKGLIDMIRKTKTLPSRQRHTDKLALQRYWLRQAEAAAERPVSKGGSPHPTTKVGAVLVDAKGREIAAAANRFAHGLDRRRPERYKDGSKSLWINCAEQMVLASALKQRKDIRGATLYVTLEPCAVCAGMIAELGLKQVCVPVGSLRRYAKLKTKWKNSIEIGLIKLAEAGVPLTTIDMGED
jgi:tRNA(Arg) A34 adenosine deaminase TadA